ncbi:MAG: phosphate-starvation-inducible PsiE family protein [Candidatus Bathyarchaeum sp.]|nr:MAG: phosphate-starvation-inducible PsiE family protein [Candidatus Bathyarchaeum sp.]
MVYLIIDNFLSPPIWLITVEKLRTILDLVLWILITIELIETVRAYLEKRTLELETVIAVALIAMARKIIAVRLRDYEATMVLGMAALIAALCLAYYLVRKSNNYPDRSSESATTNPI